MCHYVTYKMKGYIMIASAPRITARVSIDTQELLSKAAALVGISSINSFVLNAAIEKANLIMKDEHNLTLSKNDAIDFLNAIDKPIQVNEKLTKAFQDYNSKTI